MFRKLFATLAVCTFFASVQAQATNPAPSPAGYEWREIATGFDSPVGVIDLGGGTMLVMEQTGFILVVEDGEIRPAPFMDLSAQIPASVFMGGYSEQGLLGLALHPNFDENGTFFVSYTDPNGISVVERYQTYEDRPLTADPSTVERLLQVGQPFENHNGGHIVFGPDGYLYIGLGDGGSNGDPQGNGQNTFTLLGKILRIDVDELPYTIPDDNPFVGQEGFAPEIWAYGLRNPWRFTFDRETGDMYVGDVGEHTWEEVNFQPADSPGGINYGWNVFESTHPYEADEADDTGITLPFAEYSHEIGCSVTGGYVYRGEMLPEMRGVYLFGDYCFGRVWTSFYDEATDAWQTDLWMETGLVISSFAETVAGELLAVDYKGSILQLVPAT